MPKNPRSTDADPAKNAGDTPDKAAYTQNKPMIRTATLRPYPATAMLADPA
jgi:hypothetical protein